MIPKIGFYVAGLKGWQFFSEIQRECNPAFVVSYPVSGTLDQAFESIRSFCVRQAIPFFEKRASFEGVEQSADLVFIVGWQYLLPQIDERFIVFHDSLLPKYRGFAPTVSALIAGETEIGVTAIQPVAEADKGAVYAQASVCIDYPITIKSALKKIESCYVDTASEVLIKFSKGNLEVTPQDETQATYSIWRDKNDLYLNWDWSSEKIRRFVDAVGWPYNGARTIMDNEVIIIDQVEVCDELNFAERFPGKLWSLDNGCPLVVCGIGMIRIVAARYAENGDEVCFNRLRQRLGSAIVQEF